MDYNPPGPSGGLSGSNTRVGCHFPLHYSVYSVTPLLLHKPPYKVKELQTVTIFLLLNFLNFIWLLLICNVVLHSTIQQNVQLYICVCVFMCVCVCVCMYILFNILFHYGLSQDVGYRSLGYTVRPCCLSVLYIIASIYWFQIPNPSFLHPLHFSNHKSVLYVCESVSLL